MVIFLTEVYVVYVGFLFKPSLLNSYFGKNNILGD